MHVLSRAALCVLLAGSLWRIHWSVCLPSLACDFFLLAAVSSLKRAGAVKAWSAQVVVNEDNARSGRLIAGRVLRDLLDPRLRGGGGRLAADAARAIGERAAGEPARYHSWCTVTSIVAASLVPRVACSSQTATGVVGWEPGGCFRRCARNAADQVDGAPVCGWA